MWLHSPGCKLTSYMPLPLTSRFAVSTPGALVLDTQWWVGQGIGTLARYQPGKVLSLTMDPSLWRRCLHLWPCSGAKELALRALMAFLFPGCPQCGEHPA